MALSVVVPTLGVEPRLGACLDALAGLDRIVVLQGSAPAPRCERLARLEQPAGFAAAANAGLAIAATEMVALVNDDCVVDPGWATPLVRVLETDPGLAAVQGTVRREDGLVDGSGIGWNRYFEAVQRGLGGTLCEPSAPTEVFGVSATAAIYRRAALESVGGRFDELLGTWYEDVELAGRLRAAGWRAALVPGAGSTHSGAATTTRLGLSEARRVANRWLVLARLLGRELPLVLPAALLADLREARRTPVAVLAGWARAIRLAPRFAHFGPAHLGRRDLRRFSP